VVVFSDRAYSVYACGSKTASIAWMTPLDVRNIVKTVATPSNTIGSIDVTVTMSLKYGGVQQLSFRKDIIRHPEHMLCQKAMGPLVRLLTLLPKSLCAICVKMLRWLVPKVTAPTG
jgi:hypothetical protein